MDDGENLADLNLLSHEHRQFADDARSGGVDLVLHLHGFEPQDWLAGGHDVAHGGRNPDD